MKGLPGMAGIETGPPAANQLPERAFCLIGVDEEMKKVNLKPPCTTTRRHRVSVDICASDMTDAQLTQFVEHVCEAIGKVVRQGPMVFALDEPEAR